MSKYSERSLRECDRVVACQLMDKLLKVRGGQRLTQDEFVQVGRVLLEVPMSQDLKQSQGKELRIAYVTEVMSVVQPMVEQSQQSRRSQRQSCDQGLEI